MFVGKVYFGTVLIILVAILSSKILLIYFVSLKIDII